MFPRWSVLFHRYPLFRGFGGAYRCLNNTYSSVRTPQHNIQLSWNLHSNLLESDGDLTDLIVNLKSSTDNDKLIQNERFKLQSTTTYERVVVQWDISCAMLGFESSQWVFRTAIVSLDTVPPRQYPKDYQLFLEQAPRRYVFHQLTDDIRYVSFLVYIKYNINHNFWFHITYLLKP